MFTKNINWFKTIDSTNSEAFRNIATAPHGTVWAAMYQTAGRGQKGNQWESAKQENLLFSILLRPNCLPSERQFLISQVMALAVCDLLVSWQIEPTIKWPNDIYIGEKKVQGMLVEHYLSGSQLVASIVGVGINLNQVVFASDAPNPTSVLLETGVWHAPNEALLQVLVFLQKRYRGLEAGEWAQVDDAYKSKLYRYGQWANYLRCANEMQFIGKITGVN